MIFFPKYFSQEYGARGLKVCDFKTQPVLQKLKKFHTYVKKCKTFWADSGYVGKINNRKFLSGDFSLLS